MELTAEESLRKKSSERRGNARWAGVAVFVVAVVAVLIYVSSQEHDAVTLALLCLVLLAGEIFAALQWHAESKRLATDNAAGTLLEAFDRRMRQSFANQEIIHKEIHDDFEALSKRLAALELTLADSAGKRPDALGDLDEIADEIEKLNERIGVLAEEFSERLEAHTQRVQERVETAKTPPPDLKPLRERLDAIAETQDEILEKLDALFAVRADENEENDDFEADELLYDEAETNEADAFPLPEKMLERALEANAATAASAAAKLIADVPAEPENSDPVTEAPTTVVVIEYFPETKKNADVPAALPETPEGENPSASVEATPTSPPCSSSARLMRTTTMQAQTFIRHGESPMATMLFIASKLGRKMPRENASVFFGFRKCAKIHVVPQSCASTVAAPAPRMPQPKAQMKSGASATLTTTVMSVANIALRGYPEARMTWLRLKKRNVAGSPKRMTRMKS